MVKGENLGFPKRSSLPDEIVVFRVNLSDGVCGRNLHIALVREFLNGRVIRFANNIVHAYIVRYDYAQFRIQCVLIRTMA